MKISHGLLQDQEISIDFETLLPDLFTIKNNVIRINVGKWMML